jgi:hypothetical protein
MGKRMTVNVENVLPQTELEFSFAGVSGYSFAEPSWVSLSPF